MALVTLMLGPVHPAISVSSGDFALFLALNFDFGPGPWTWPRLLALVVQVRAVTWTAG